MKRTRNILCGLAVVGLIGAAAIRVNACGGYGPPHDPLVIAAISEDTAKSQEAVAKLRKLGKGGVHRVARYQRGLKRNINMYTTWVNSRWKRLQTNVGTMSVKHQQALVKNLQIIENSLKLMQRQLQATDRLLIELRNHNQIPVG